MQQNNVKTDSDGSAKTGKRLSVKDKESVKDTSDLVDNFIADYYKNDFASDFRSLTPYQRISLFIRCLGMRLPKFKAIDLHTDSNLSESDLMLYVGRWLRGFIPPQLHDNTGISSHISPDSALCAEDQTALLPVDSSDLPGN